MTSKDYSKPQWFLLYTRPHQEERAKENLENQGYEVFLPMIAYKKISQPNSISIEPMFPRYMFITINTERDNWVHIKSTRGVSHMVVFGDNLTVVPNSVMDYLKSKVDDNDVLKLKTIRKTFHIFVS